VIGRALVILSAASALVAASVSCRPVRNASTETSPDSLTGIVSITGTSFEQQLMLRSGDSSVRLSATSPDSAALSRMGGIEVIVAGKRAGDSLRIARFTALRVAGSPVVDGVLREDGGRLVLETHQGKLPLGNPPSALRSMIGARVWIGGPLDSGPNIYGVIAPRL
jgi:hypothetical protein